MCPPVLDSSAPAAVPAPTVPLVVPVIDDKEAASRQWYIKWCIIILGLLLVVLTSWAYLAGYWASTTLGGKYGNQVLYPKRGTLHPAYPGFYNATTPVSLGAGFLGFVALITLFAKIQPVSTTPEVA
jgi:hypothetical protein